MARVVRRFHELPGKSVFQYDDESVEVNAITSGDVNEALREFAGADFTAKDFRTWHATLHALTLLRKVALPKRASDRALRTSINTVIKEVATGLRNTPAVCRKSYINPAVFDAWKDARLERPAARPPPSPPMMA